LGELTRRLFFTTLTEGSNTDEQHDSAGSDDRSPDRFFAGLTLDEAANHLGVVRHTADRYGAFARSWPHDALRKSEDAAET
jgi:ECF sigma factor